MINIPLYVLVGLGILNLGMEIGRHGQPENGTHNAWTTLISIILQIGLIIWAVNW